MKNAILAKKVYPKLFLLATPKDEPGNLGSSCPSFPTKQYIPQPITKSAVLEALQRVKRAKNITVLVVYGYVKKDGRRVRVANEGLYGNIKEAKKAIFAFLEE